MVRVIDAGTDSRNKFGRAVWQLSPQPKNKVIYFNINRLYKGVWRSRKSLLNANTPFKF